MSQSAYVVALKRDRRASAPSDWAAQVRRIAGVTVIGDASDQRMQIEATDEAIREIQHRFAEDLHVEPVLPRQRL